MDAHKTLETVTASLIARAKQRHDEETVRDIEQQKEEGRCNLIPLPNVATQPFRSELTLERHPLFVVDSFKGNCFLYERSVKHPESGEEVIQRIAIGQVGQRTFGVLKQVHQEVFYKLLKLWGEKGHPLDGSRGVLHTTVYELVTYLRGNDASPHYQRVRTLLRELNSIPITFENAYTWQGIQDLKEFTLIDGIQWDTRSLDKKSLRPKAGGKSEVSILFSKTVTEGFTRKNIKQLLWSAYASIGSGKGRKASLARLLYPMLDYELASKDQFHISLCALAKRFGLPQWPYRSKRKEKFLPSLRFLQGKPILSERYQLDLHLSDSADGSDFILHAKRTPYQLTLQGI